ncbi:hypothetical protein M8C21_027232, partial [Ambrosia artemisiifolia]
KTNNNFHVSLEAIKAGTQNFSDYTCVGERRFWKLYEGEITDANGCTAIFAKRWDSKAHQKGCEDHSQSLTTFETIAIQCYNKEGNLDNMIFDGIKEQITPPSLTTFQTIAIQCLEVYGFKRPTITQLITQLKKALEFQEDYEIWEPKLPIDYKEIIKRSKTPDIYNDKTKKDLYDMLSKGILLQDDKVLFSLGSNGERNEMISAKRFSYKNHLRKWRSLPESRFPKVAEMLYISNLNIRIKIRTQFLSPCVNYKVHLIFKFCGSRKSQAKRMYVNLKYKMGNESLNAYFATLREDGWMMIELFQFFNHKKDTDFEVKHEEIEKLKEVQQLLKSTSKTDKLSPSNMKVKKVHMTWFSLSEIKRKKDEMLSAKKVVYNSSNVGIQSRFVF